MPGSPSSTTPVNIVAFDFDDTILEGHSPVRLIRALALRRIISYSVALKALLWGLRYKLRLPVEQAQVRKCLYEGLAHMPAESADQIMIDFYHEDLCHRLRPLALKQIAAHKSEGAVVVIVSASFYPIIKEVAHDLDVDHFISTQMKAVEGFYNGEVIGEPPEGPQKLIQLSNWANETFGESKWCLTCAYGDHRSDAPMLQAAQRPMVVNPDTGLYWIAKRRRWEMLDWQIDIK